MYNSSTITLQNAATTTGNGITFAPDGADSLTVEIYGSATSSTVVFEEQGKSLVWYPIQGIRHSDYKLAAQSTTKGEIWDFDMNGVTAFRTRISAISGGNISVVAKGVVNNG